MNDSPSADHPDELVIAEILARADVGGDAAILDGIARYPHLAAQIIKMYRLQKALRASRPGDSLNPEQRVGDFRILGKVGGGGMGEVYQAEQISLGGRKVALKVIRNDRATEAMKERFRREQQILARLHQTHIVPIHVAGEEGGLHYLVMPFIDGAALHDLIAAVRQQPAGRAPALSTLIEEAGRQRGRSKVHDHEPAPAGRPRRLAPGYFRLVAALMADAAEAVEAVHQAGFLHRDLKPANLMVDRQGKCWIIDFGLACPFAEASTPEGAGAPVTADGARTVSSAAGTPEYMAPEQRQGKADRRSDVWGLGATLYELVYLERVGERRPGGSGVVAGVPEDLAAICERALHEKPAQRYGSAGEFARDLRRWLAHEPTEARGATLWRSTWLLVRRNPERAAAVAGVTLAIVTTLVGLFLLQRQEATQARALADAAERGEREQRRQTLLGQIEQMRPGQRRAGWRREGWSLVARAVELGIDERLRELAAGLDGVDAYQVESFSGVSASSVAFDKLGRRLLLGGLEGQPARLWSGRSAPLRSSQRSGAGPVAFDPDGTPLQLVVDAEDRGRLVLWDVDRQRMVRSFPLPSEPKENKSPRLVMTPDGAFVAVAVAGRVAVWETRSSRCVREFDCEATALALAADGSLLAAGNDEGMVKVWSLPAGERVVDLRNEGVQVTSLAFHRDVRRGTGDGAGRWVLAAGSPSSILTWELPSGTPRVRCVGSEYEVYALAFSPDGMTLASAGRFTFCLWDLATGQRLLEAPVGDIIPGLAFSPDGTRLACACRLTFNGGDVSVWSIETGRSLRILRGLSTPVSKVAFSADSRFLAALGHGWEVGVWELASGRLLHVLSVPRGRSADNAALAFGPDGQFAFAAGQHATLWRLGPGKVERKPSWRLPPGLVDGLTFVGRDRLLLFRAEPRDGVWGAPPEHAFVLRVRNLLGSAPTRPFMQPEDLYWRVFHGVLSPDGRLIVASGRKGPRGATTTLMITAAYEVATGKRLWDREWVIPEDGDYIPIDPGGSAVAIYHTPTEREMVEIGTGQKVAAVREKYPAGTVCFGSGPWYPTLTVNEENGRRRRYALTWMGRPGKAVPLPGQKPADESAGCFDRRGRLLARGNRDGTVTLWDLEELRRRLNEVGLGWEE